MTASLTLPGIGRPGAWQVRNRLDAAANALADRHYSRRRPGSGQIGPPGRKLVLVTGDEAALWLTHWPYPQFTLDGVDAWRCSIFRNEGPQLSSELILAAEALTAQLWTERPTDGWLTWVDRRHVTSANPGWCFLMAGWTKDRDWHHPHLIRLRKLLPAFTSPVTTCPDNSYSEVHT